MTKKDIINLIKNYCFEIDDKQVEELLKEFKLIEKKILILDQFDIENLKPTFLSSFVKNNFLRSDNYKKNEQQLNLLFNNLNLTEDSLIIVAHKKNKKT